MQTYISVNPSSETDMKVKMTNKENEFNGTLKTKDSQDGTVKDVNEIFVNKGNVKDMTTIDGEEYELEDVVAKLNDLITNLQK